MAAMVVKLRAVAMVAIDKLKEWSFNFVGVYSLNGSSVLVG